MKNLIILKMNNNPKFLEVALTKVKRNNLKMNLMILTILVVLMIFKIKI